MMFPVYRPKIALRGPVLAPDSAMVVRALLRHVLRIRQEAKITCRQPSDLSHLIHIRHFRHALFYS